MIDKSRRKLFKTFATSRKKELFFLRPPYAKREALFLEQCYTCKEAPCASICEEGIIQINNQTPIISFIKSGCTYCKACANVCPKDVLGSESTRYINANFSINTTTCLAWNGVVCFTCKEFCDENAIEFFGMFRPQIHSNKCTSCGFCFSPCPVNAINMKIEEII